jgi:type IV pilus assembly protein PilC
MATYAYVVRDQAGAVRKGTTEAENEEVLGRRLREQGFQVNEIKAARKKKNPNQGNFFENMQKIKMNELAIFFRQFSVMQDAGVSLVRSMGVLAEQTQNARLRRVIHDIQREVESGNPLSKAMAKYPTIFSNLMVGLVRAGEIGGVLEETMQRLSTFVEKDVALKRKVKSAMSYPTTVMFLATGIVVAICTFIVPKFIDLFKQLGVKDFPIMTEWLMDFSEFLLNDWYWCAAIYIGTKTALTMFGRTKVGARVFDYLKIKFPAIGPLNHKVCLARFSRTLGTLLVSGVPILQAMETVANTVSNSQMQDAIMEARARVREGDRVGDPLKKSGLFPPMVVHMIAIGEESGALDQMLGKIADFYEDEVDAALSQLASAIEPIMIVVLGGIVLFVLIALWMPIISVISNLSGGGDGDNN